MVGGGVKGVGRWVGLISLFRDRVLEGSGWADVCVRGYRGLCAV